MLDRHAPSPARYLRTHQAAQILGLSPRTLEKYRCHGSGPTFRKLGGRVVYLIDDLDAWLPPAPAGPPLIRIMTRPALPALIAGEGRMDMQARHILTASERSRLLPFVVASGEISPRDQRDLMERPFFSLSKTKRTTPILYAVGDTRVEVFGMPEHGMATIWDADVLIWPPARLSRRKISA